MAILRVGVILGVLVVLSMSSLYAVPIIWDGPNITFTKPDFADWTLEENQDRITDNVWLTRANVRGLFNIQLEESYAFLSDSPQDTEWSYGNLADYDTLTYKTWENLSSGFPFTMVGQDAVLHLISDDIYLHIKFTSWTIGPRLGAGSGGGGFSYERSTSNVPEPTTFALIAVGLAALLVTRFRKP
jgi:hypothetical protein